MDNFKTIISVRRGTTGLKSYSWKHEKNIVRRIARRVLKLKIKREIESDRNG